MKKIRKIIVNNKIIVMFILFITQFSITGLRGIFNIIQLLLIYLMIQVAFMEYYYEEN